MVSDVSFSYSSVLQTSFALHHSLPSTFTTCSTTLLNVNGTKDMSFIFAVFKLEKNFESENISNKSLTTYLILGKIFRVVYQFFTYSGGSSVSSDTSMSSSQTNAVSGPSFR